MTALRPTVRLEHRLTRPNASMAELDAAIGLAVGHELASLAVSPWLVKPAARILSRTSVQIGTVIGYPFGGQVAAVKAFEASTALEHGATELDFVLNAGALVAGDDEAALDDMLAVVEMAHSALAQVGVILQAGQLSDELILRACRLAARAGVDHVVTSSGEHSAAVGIDLTRFLQRAIGEQLTVKAAGTFDDFSQLMDAASAGARIISTSFSPELAADARAWLQEAALVAAASGSDLGAAAG